MTQAPTIVRYNLSVTLHGQWQGRLICHCDSWDPSTNHAKARHSAELVEARHHRKQTRTSSLELTIVGNNNNLACRSSPRPVVVPSCCRAHQGSLLSGCGKEELTGARRHLVATVVVTTPARSVSMGLGVPEAVEAHSG
jgi:hypothetical protein